MSGVKRSLKILHAVGNVHAKTLTAYIDQIRGLLEEAQDNVKFLSTIRKPTQVLVTSMDFKEMRTTLPNLMNSLRNIWMLSKHFNTDDQICNLLDKITNIILGRVRSFVDFKLLHKPTEAESISKESRSLLTGWNESFEKTRRAIEESGREARWEFSVQKQFCHVNHASNVCHDIASVANILYQLQCCFTDQLICCTRKPDLIVKARQRTQEMTESFVQLNYDAFDPANAHHWKNHIEWFHREVRFVDAESASIAEEVYDHLLLSKLAIDALHGMIDTNYRKDIGRRLLAKVGLIIKKFTVEIQEDEAMFRSKMHDPPLAENLPPISGAIYWSNDIEKNLAQTLNSLSSVLYVTENSTWPAALQCYEAFLKELHQYKVNYQSCNICC
jgi:dynein heavy chain